MCHKLGNNLPPVSPNIFGSVLRDIIDAIVASIVPIDSCKKLPVPIITPSPINTIPFII